MDLPVVISLLTTVVSVLVKVVGFPDQIKSNYRRKSTVGLSSWFVLSAFISYILWTIHGFQVHDDALVIGQGLGVVTTGVIVWQIYLYRVNQKKHERVSDHVFALLANRIVSKPGISNITVPANKVKSLDM